MIDATVSKRAMSGVKMHIHPICENVTGNQIWVQTWCECVMHWVCVFAAVPGDLAHCDALGLRFCSCDGDLAH